MSRPACLVALISSHTFWCVKISQLTRHTAPANLLGARSDSTPEQLWDGLNPKLPEDVGHLVDIVKERLHQDLPLPLIKEAKEEDQTSDSYLIATWGHRVKGVSCVARVYFPHADNERKTVMVSAVAHVMDTKESRDVIKAGLMKHLPTQKANPSSSKDGSLMWTLELGDVSNPRTWEEINELLHSFRTALGFADKKFAEARAVAATEAQSWETAAVGMSRGGALPPGLQNEREELSAVVSVYRNVVAEASEALHRFSKKFRAIWRKACVPAMAAGGLVAAVAAPAATTKVLGVIGFVLAAGLFIACAPKIAQAAEVQPEAAERIKALATSECIDLSAVQRPTHKESYNAWEDRENITECIKDYCEKNLVACNGWVEEWDDMLGAPYNQTRVEWVLSNCLPTNRPHEPNFNHSHDTQLSRCLAERYEEQLTEHVNAVLGDNSTPLTPRLPAKI